MFNKKNIFVGSLILSIFFLLFIFFVPITYCESNYFCNEIFNLVNFFGLTSFIFPIIFLFSLITYKMSNVVFEYWANFAKWYVPLFLFFALTISSSSQGGDFSGVINDWFSTMILLLALIVFFLISLIGIISKYNSLKKS